MVPGDRAERTVHDMTAGITKETRKAVYKRDGYRCALCDSTDGLQIHHIKRRGEGGSSHPMNLITLCWRCHSAAHGSLYAADELGYKWAWDKEGGAQQAAQRMKDDIELACVEYVADLYAKQGEIWYPWEG